MLSTDKKTSSLAFAGLIALSLIVSGCAAVAARGRTDDDRGRGTGTFRIWTWRSCAE